MFFNFPEYKLLIGGKNSLGLVSEWPTEILAELIPPICSLLIL